MTFQPFFFHARARKLVASVDEGRANSWAEYGAARILGRDATLAGHHMSAHSCTHAQCGVLLSAPLPPGSGLQKCAGCRHVAYCSRACQAEMWKRTHKQECSALRAAGVGVGLRGSQQPEDPRCPCRIHDLTAHQRKMLLQLYEPYLSATP